MEISKGQLHELIGFLNRYMDLLNGYYTPDREEDVQNIVYQLQQILDSEH